MFKYFEPNKIFSVTSKAPKYVLILFIIVLSIGLTESLIFSPEDYKQSHSVRIMYVHVPAAWITLGIFTSITILSLIGFIFKIHANIDPKHRDRIAFLRICSGIFERNKRFLNVRSNKDIKFSNPTAFMAQEKSIVDYAYPGDIIGLHDTGNLKIGDTISDHEKFMFKGIPSFSPEIFKRVVNLDPLKTKQLTKTSKKGKCTI